jgi:hypothetical protein
MIPRLAQSSARFTKESPFLRDVRAKPLRILVSPEVEREIGDKLSPPALLIAHEHHPMVEVYRYSSDALWHVSADAVDEPRDALPLRVTKGSDWQKMAGIWPYAQWQSLSQIVGVPHESLVILRTAIALDCDLVVTTTDSVLSHRQLAVVGDANPLEPIDAVALLGLYLRAHGDFAIEQRSGYSMRVDRGLFYSLAARRLVPGWQRWLAGAAHSSRVTKDERLLMIALSFFQRLDRCLRARDAVQVQMQLPPDADSADEALAQLDILLLFMGGCFDGIARVVDSALGQGTEPYEIGFRRRRWLASTSSNCHAIGSIVEGDSSGRALIDLVGLMRNSVHSVALQTIRVRDEAGDDRNLAALPREQAAQVAAATERLGGLTQWGLTRLQNNQFILDPAVFVESVLHHALPIMAALVAATPVERLPGVAGASMDALPIDTSSPYASDDIQQRIGWLVGIESADG